jgi:metal-dependent amidase/aminoacylase/carboxypeptidase family protein
MDDIKAAACKAIDDHADELNALSQEIWNNPELAFQEHHSHDVLSEFLQTKLEMKVDRKYTLDTAFRGVYSADVPGPRVAVLCEYDALPGIGHACGHNLIAEVGVATTLGIKAALDAAKQPLGSVR